MEDSLRDETEQADKVTEKDHQDTKAPILPWSLATMMEVILYTFTIMLMVVLIIHWESARLKLRTYPGIVAFVTLVCIV